MMFTPVANYSIWLVISGQLTNAHLYKFYYGIYVSGATTSGLDSNMKFESYERHEGIFKISFYVCSIRIFTKFQGNPQYEVLVYYAINITIGFLFEGYKFCGFHGFRDFYEICSTENQWKFYCDTDEEKTTMQICENSFLKLPFF